MGFPWTLQKYIFREMGKTFLLTAAALTGVLGLGGGVLQMIQLGEITAGQLTRLMGLVLPVAVALTLPIAALFSAAATYGRLSADNEFVACRSSGINLHVLLLPTVLLSFASALVTFVFINFLIPGMVRNLNEFVASDVGAFIRQRLNRPRGLTLGGRYRICADDTTIDESDENHLALHRVAFVEVDGRTDEWVRYGTAREVNLVFERSPAGIRASGAMSGLSFFDRRTSRFADLAQQSLSVNELQTLVPAEIKFLNLFDLFHYARDPGSWHQVATAFDAVRSGLGRRWTYDAILEDWTPDKQFTLQDTSLRFLVRAAGMGRLPRDAGLQLTDVSIEEDRAGHRRTYSAKEATLDVARGDPWETSGVRLEAFGVRLEAFGVRARDGQTTVEHAKESLGPVPLDPAVLQRVAAVKDRDLLADRTANPDDPLPERVEKAREILGAITRRIKATISERIAFSVSVLTLVILGAVLGIVFRGSHVVVAFGISFIPALVVIMTIVTGRQLACNANTHLFGLVLSWTGLLVVVILDGWTLTRVLRR